MNVVIRAWQTSWMVVLPRERYPSLPHWYLVVLFRVIGCRRESHNSTDWLSLHIGYRTLVAGCRMETLFNISSRSFT